MNAQQLKNSILQMAVQGKLVPQDPNDEPASVLLERIRKEKEQLIKEGKIKKEKNPSYIFRGADNTPYEKIGNAEPVSISDEVPFDIPDSWEWCRFSSVIELQSGQDMVPEKYNAVGKGIPYITGASNIEDGKVIINRWTESPKAFAYKGNILLTCKGTVGTMAILNESEVHIARQIMAIKPSPQICTEYIQIVLSSLVTQLKASAKSMIPGIGRDDVLKALLPLPPRSEQNRIVLKVAELDEPLAEYEQRYNSLQVLNNGFAEQLKKSILQLAIQGKLVPEDPNDEPASILLERIHAEKERLIKEGKIKNDKNESIIYRRDNSHYEKQGSTERCIDNELPFEIPENWEWARCSSLGAIVRGRGIKRTETTTDGLPCIRYGEIYTSYNTSFVETKSFIPADIDANCLHLSHGDLVFTLTGENKIDIAKTVAYLGDSPVAAGGDLAYWTAHGMNPLYIVYFMASPYCIELKRSTATGDIIVHISTEKVGSFLIPVPPKAEQDRIVEAISSSFAIVETL